MYVGLPKTKGSYRTWFSLKPVGGPASPPGSSQSLLPLPAVAITEVCNFVSELTRAAEKSVGNKAIGWQCKWGKNPVHKSKINESSMLLKTKTKWPKWQNVLSASCFLLLPLFRKTSSESVNAAYIKKALANSLAIFKLMRPRFSCSRTCFPTTPGGACQHWRKTVNMTNVSIFFRFISLDGPMESIFQTCPMR